MSSYWNAMSKLPLEQLSVSVPAENGTNHSATQEIRFRIPPSIKFFNPKESYLQCDIKLTPPYSATNTCGASHTQPCYLGLDAEIGAQSLIRTIRLRDGNGTLLEEIDGYNVMVALKYDYDTNNSIRGKRALTEGSTVHSNKVRGYLGSTRTPQNEFISNPAFTKGDGTTRYQDNNFVDCKVCIPLHTGILSNDKIFPNMLMGNGLQISILLEDNVRVFRTMDGATLSRRPLLNPMLQGLRGGNGSAVDDRMPITSASATDTFYLAPQNSQISVENCPFVVGELLGFATNPFREADIITTKTTGGTTIVPQITAIDYDSGSGTKITVDRPIFLDVASMTTYSDTSACMTTNLGGANNPICVFSKSNTVGTLGQSPSYEVKNSEMILQKIDVPAQYENEMMMKMKSGGTITYDFLSATNYKYSQLKGDVVASINLPINNARCKSIIGVPTDATRYTIQQVLTASNTYNIVEQGTTNTYLTQDRRLQQQRVGLEGISDFLTDYQFIYDGRLQPSRRVNVEKTSSKKAISQQHLIELDKALTQANIPARSLQRFNENFCIGRALSLGNGVYDARNRDFQLQLNYGGTAPTKDKLWNFFVFHLRRMEVKGDNVSVVV
jgi:hypothetical protein